MPCLILWYVSPCFLIRGNQGLAVFTRDSKLNILLKFSHKTIRTLALPRFILIQWSKLDSYFLVKVALLWQALGSGRRSLFTLTVYRPEVTMPAESMLISLPTCTLILLPLSRFAKNYGFFSFVVQRKGELFLYVPSRRHSKLLCRSALRYTYLINPRIPIPSAAQQAKYNLSFVPWNKVPNKRET